MEQIILIIHVLIALAIIGLILIQQGKGADMGASFGAGASQTLFGSGGGGNVLTKVTAILTTLFFVTSFSLAVIAKNNSDTAGDVDIAVPTVVEADLMEEDIPTAAEGAADMDIPALEESAAEDSDIPAL